MSKKSVKTTKAQNSAKSKLRNGVKNNGLSLIAREKTGGAVLACGQGDFGQLGLGEDVTEKTRPAKVPDMPYAVNVCAGGIHSLVLSADGVLLSFGCNDEFALGRTTTDEFSPGSIELPDKVVRMTAGDSHSACLLEDGRVFAWGSFRDSHGSMGLTVDGKKEAPVEMLKGRKFADIASGTDHLVMLSQYGEVYTVGCGEQGQLGRISQRAMSNVSRHGQSNMLEPRMLTLQKKASAIWASAYCTFFREKGTDDIYAVGLNNYNQLFMPDKTEIQMHIGKTNFKNILKIAGGQHHTLALTNDFKCFAVGRCDYGRLGLGQLDGDVTELTPIKALVDETIVDIACGDTNSFALTKDGRVFAWGLGSNNQLGVGQDEDAFTPVLLTGLQVKDKKVIKVSGGGQHTLFIVEEPNPEAVVEKPPIAAGRKRKAASSDPVDNDEPKKTSRRKNA